MNRVLAAEEMKEKYPSEWLLVCEPETDSALEVVSGEVACHSKDRDEVYQAVALLKPKRFATLYTGQIPKDAAVVL